MDMRNVYYKQLSNIEKCAYDTIYMSIKNFAKKIKLNYLLEVSQVKKVMIALSNENPQLFYIDFFEYKFVMYDQYSEVILNYLYDFHTIKILICKYKKYLNTLSFLCEKDLKSNSLLKKCLWIHNYLVKNISYDKDAANSKGYLHYAHSIVGVIEKNSAVCDGISKFFQLFCLVNNINCILVCGNSSFSDSDVEGHSENCSGHAWNIISIDDKYTHVDVTWDLCLSQTSNFYRFDYFGLSDLDIKSDHIFNTEFTLPQCNEKYLFNYFYFNDSLICDYMCLKLYVEKMLKKKSRYIYFKIDKGRRLPENLFYKIDKWMDKMINKNINCACKYHVILNKEQLVFFYKIEYKE